MGSFYMEFFSSKIMKRFYEELTYLDPILSSSPGQNPIKWTIFHAIKWVQASCLIVNSQLKYMSSYTKKNEGLEGEFTYLDLTLSSSPWLKSDKRHGFPCNKIGTGLLSQY